MKPNKVNLRPHKTLILIEVETVTETKTRLKANLQFDPSVVTAQSSQGGIILASESDLNESYEETHETNKCWAVRVGNKVEEVSEGDYCIYTKGSGAELTYRDKKYRLIKEDDIQIIIEKVAYE